MKANINKTDKLIRLVIAIALVVLYMTDLVTGTAGIVLLIAAAVLVATALINFCPIYRILGISTKKKTQTQ